MLSLCILADDEPVTGLRNASPTSVGMFQRIPRKQLPTSKDVVLGVGRAVCGRGCLVPSRAAHGRLAFPPNQTRGGGDIGNISTCTDDLAEAMTLRFPSFWREQYRVQVQRPTAGDPPMLFRAICPDHLTRLSGSCWRALLNITVMDRAQQRLSLESNSQWNLARW